jgi:hypothetical protein
VEHVVIYIYTHVNAVVNSVVLQLYLRHYFYNIIIKVSPPPMKNSGRAPAVSGVFVYSGEFSCSMKSGSCLITKWEMVFLRKLLVG